VREQMKVTAWKTNEGVTPNTEINLTDGFNLTVEFAECESITLRFYKGPQNGRILLETQDGRLKLEPECGNVIRIGVEKVE